MWGRVVYVSGESADFTTGNAALAAWERYALARNYPIGAASPPMLSSLVIAHHALGLEQDVDAWADTVEDVELHHRDELPPTRPEPSTVSPQRRP